MCTYRHCSLTRTSVAVVHMAAMSSHFARGACATLLAIATLLPLSCCASSSTSRSYAELDRQGADKVPARIVFFPLSVASHFYQAQAIIRELAMRGHKLQVFLRCAAISFDRAMLVPDLPLTHTLNLFLAGRPSRSLAFTSSAYTQKEFSLQHPHRSSSTVSLRCIVSTPP